LEQLVLELAPSPAPTLDNFHPGGNAAALGALRTVLDENKGVLFLWGSAGCGKTHLLQAAAAAARLLGKRAQYLHAGAVPPLGDLAFLALDDVEKLDAAAQTMLFDTFNRMRSAGGVIVAAGSLPPTDLGLREDLRTRLASGIVMQIRSLSDAEKRTVLASRARDLGLELTPEIIDYLIDRYARDLGSLVGAVDALNRYSLRTQRAITLPLLRESQRIAADPIATEPKKQVSP
jgi:DnaA family protein